MYIGNTDVSGLHHLFIEVVDNSIDEAMAGTDTIHATVHEDGSRPLKITRESVEVHSKTSLPWKRS